MLNRQFLILILVLVFPLAVNAESISPNAQLRPSTQNLSLPTIQGGNVSPLSAPEDRVSVVIFVTTDCPIANGYQPTIRRLSQSWKEQQIPLTLVHVRQDVSLERALNHAEQFQIETPVVIDKDRLLVDALNANVTPEAFVINGNGQVVYRGRIDNWYAGYGKKRTRATQHDLANAVNNALAGEQIAEPVTKPIGCYIPN